MPVRGLTKFGGVCSWNSIINFLFDLKLVDLGKYFKKKVIKLLLLNLFKIKLSRTLWRAKQPLVFFVLLIIKFFFTLNDFYNRFLLMLESLVSRSKVFQLYFVVLCIESFHLSIPIALFLLSSRWGRSLVLCTSTLSIIYLSGWFVLFFFKYILKSNVWMLSENS